MKENNKDIYEIIENKLGLTESQIDTLFEKNKFLEMVIPGDILQVIRFFEGFGITREELSQIALKNEWILTESFERVRYIQKFLGMVDITDIRWMAVNHPISMSVNPITIKDFIEQNRAEGKSDKEIRNLIMNDFEKYFKA